jgi:hypothetical protein
VSLKQLKGFPLSVPFVVILAAGVIAVMKVAVVVHDLNPFQVRFEQFEILPKKRLKIFILPQSQPCVIGG